MKKIYYFSKDKLQFIEIKNFKYKLALTASTAIIIICVILFGSYSYLFSLTNSHRNISSLKSENEILKEKLLEISQLYQVLDNDLEGLIIQNKELRVAANLPPVSDDIRLLGYGGGSFDNPIDLLFSPNALEITKAVNLTEELSRKISFEKNNFNEIASALNDNKELHKSIPAIKPCDGSFAYHGFGMRMHPILNKVRMHEGIDIIASTGTSVLASGKGKVDFVGYKGSYGLTVEIDHGFGYRTLYAHLSKTLVKKGDMVNRGNLIAKTGNTGLSTGPHLHYEIEHKGVKQDPAKFIFDDVNLFN